MNDHDVKFNTDFRVNFYSEEKNPSGYPVQRYFVRHRKSYPSFVTLQFTIEVYASLVCV